MVNRGVVQDIIRQELNNLSLSINLDMDNRLQFSINYKSMEIAKDYICPHDLKQAIEQSEGSW